MKIKKPYIIAEIGVNHNGSVDLAKKIISKCQKLGASAVKFQTYITENIVATDTLLADYQKNSIHQKTQFEMLKKYELSFSNFISLFNHAKKLKIDFISTAHDIESLSFLAKELKIKTIKISSADLTNIQLLIHAGRTKKNLIISSGLSSINEIDIALSAICYGAFYKDFNFRVNKHKFIYKKYSSYLEKKVKLLHCTSEYPAPLNELNLNIIDTLSERYSMDIGYSDHSNDTNTAVILSTKNVSIIEVHVTPDNNLNGPDHKASLSYQSFAKYVKNIEKTHIMLGKYIKNVTCSERRNIKVVRKKLFFGRVKSRILTDLQKKNSSIFLKTRKIKKMA